MTPLIRSGTMNELKTPSGDWCFVDVGFSSDKKTCGYLLATVGAEERSQGAREVTYAVLGDVIAALLGEPRGPLHLVLEAPISAAFTRDGNPLGRSIEKRGQQTRYWYVGLGCSVLVATLYLLKRLIAEERKRELRVFEGFVSFKKRDSTTGHANEAEAMKAVVWSGGQTGGDFCVARTSRTTPGGTIGSTLELLGLDPTPPPIVRVNP